MTRQKIQQNNKLIWIIIILLVILAGFLIYLKYKPKEKLIEVEQEEEKSAAIYCLMDNSFQNASTTETTREKIIKQCVHISDKGVVLREAMLITGGPFLVIYNQNNQNLIIGQEAIKPRVLEFIAKIKNNFAKLKPENFPALSEFSLISSIADDVEILTVDNWKIYLDASRDADKQLELLFATFKQKGPPKEYIDLRIEGKIYLK